MFGRSGRRRIDDRRAIFQRRSNGVCVDAERLNFFKESHAGFSRQDAAAINDSVIGPGVSHGAAFLDRPPDKTGNATTPAAQPQGLVIAKPTAATTTNEPIDRQSHYSRALALGDSGRKSSCDSSQSNPGRNSFSRLEVDRRE